MPFNVVSMPCSSPSRHHPSCILAAVWLAAGCLLPSALVAETALDLSDRIVIDGASGEYTEGEALFGLNEERDNAPEESQSDSQWGANNDLQQLYLTWDADFVYLSVDAVIWDNNLIVWFDTVDGSPDTPSDDGMVGMTELNSWRRNFVFDNDLTPDLFVATWDGNTTPQMWTSISTNNVTQVPVESFPTVATFSQGARGRAMEAAIPWQVFWRNETTREFDPVSGDSLYTVPEASRSIFMAAAVTAGGDGTGGPDSAPDNFTGHTTESSDQVAIDNYIILEIDADGDGFPDLDIEPRERVSFLARPPIRGVRFELGQVYLNRPYVSPEQGVDLQFSFTLSPEVSEDDEFRRVTVTSEIWNMRGDRVRTLYRDNERQAAEVDRPALDRWDGRDDDGQMVDGGIYVLRVVVEPGIFRSKTAFAVVR